LNKTALAKSQSVLNSLLLRWPKWVVFGWCRKDLDKYNPHNALKYLVLRQLSYSLDVLEEVSREKKRKKTGPRKDSHSSLQYWAYVLYAPLFMHGPVMLYHNFRSSPAANVKVNALGIREKTENPSQRVVLSRVVHQFTLTLGRLSSGLILLCAMIATTSVLIFALQTFYMPTIVFLKMHCPSLQVQPMNLQGPEYFVYGQMLLMFIFLNSHVIFGSSRAMAILDGVEAPNDTPVSHLRSSLSVRQHWKKFHVSWRDFFLRYIYSFSNGDFEGLVLVIAFSSFIHGFYAQWFLWGLVNLVAISLERVLFSKKKSRGKGTKIVMSTVNQTLAFVLQLMIFIPFSIVSKPSQGDPVDRSRYMALSFRALASFALWNFGFSLFNCLRIIAPQTNRERHHFW